MANFVLTSGLADEEDVIANASPMARGSAAPTLPQDQMVDASQFVSPETAPPMARPQVEAPEEEVQVLNSFNELPFSEPEIEQLSSFEELPFTEDAPEEDMATLDSFDDLPFSELEPAEDMKTTGLTQTDILNSPEDMTAIKGYMVERLGVQWNERSNEELLDAYITHMRYVNTNELSTFGEYRYVTNGDDNTKLTAKQAYAAYDKLGGFWSNGTWGDTAEGAKDYVAAILTSPSTYLGGIIGKTVVKGATTAAQKAAVQATARAAFRAAEKTAGGTGLRAASEVLAANATRKAWQTVGVATVADASLISYQDVMYQQTMMEAGAQDEYDPTQTLIAATGGVVGGAVAATPLLARQVFGEPLTHTKAALQEAKIARGKVAVKTAMPRIKASVEKLNKASTNWAKMVKSGESINPTMNDASELAEWFFNPKNPESLLNILLESGARFKTSKDVPFTEDMIGFAKNLPKEDLDELNQVLKPTGLTFGEMTDVIARSANQGGTTLGLASQAKQAAKAAMQLSSVKKKSDLAILNMGGELLDAPKEDATSPETVRYIQSVWRRTLISNPATTMANVYGWAQVGGAKSLAEVLHGGVLGTAGLVGKMTGGAFGDKAFGTSKALMKHQVFKARTLLDPYASKDAFLDLIDQAPKNLKEASLRSFFGGVDTEDAVGHFGMVGPDGKMNPLVKAAEKYADFATHITLVKAQDIYTKSMSGMIEMDKISRLELGKGIDQVVKDGEMHLFTEEMWGRTVQEMLKDTMSADYTKGGSMMSGMANIVEKASNTPGLGFLFPFGRFMNNNIAFVMEYTPMAVANMGLKTLSRSGRKELGEKGAFEVQEAIAKATVGTVGLATLINYSQQARDEGFQWYEQESADGTIINRQNLAPVSVFMVAGRIGDMIKQGESVPVELWTELGKQLGPGQLAQEISGYTLIGDMVTSIGSSNPDEKASIEAVLASSMAGMLGQVGAGFTRPLQAPNEMVGAITGNDETIDMRLAESDMEKATFELTRYTRHLFEPFLGEKIGEAKRSAARPEGDIRPPNFLSNLSGAPVLPAKNHTDKLLGKVGLPPFLVDQRSGIPAFDRYVNEVVGPKLNSRAEALMKNESFKKAPENLKLQQVKDLLTDVRAEMNQELEDGSLGGPDQRLLQARKAWTGVSETSKNLARQALHIDTPDNKLTGWQIEAMKEYIKSLEDFQKSQR